MLKLDREQRVLLSEKLGDVANLTFGALVLSQFVGDRAFSVGAVAAGFLSWAVVFGWALRLRKGGS